MSFTTRAAAVVVAQLALAGPAAGQPWVPPEGEGTVSVSYQNYYTLGHYGPQGQANTNGATHAKAIAVEFDYGLTDSLALVVGVPFIASKYTGPQWYFVEGIQTFPGPLDDREYHGAVQDVRVELRRQFVAARLLAVTPFVGGTVPSHAYETVGEAVPGRRRPELQLGVSAGLPLQFMPGGYVHAGYRLGTAPPLNGFWAVRSVVDVEGGVNALPRVGVRGLLTWQMKNKGPRARELAADWINHDRYIVGDFFNAGAGVTISWTESIDASAVWMQTLSGRNGAHVARVLTLAVTWSFGGRFGGFDP